MFFVLNLWMCALNGPFWTGLTESDKTPLTCCGRIIDSECYGVVCSVWGTERIMRLYHSINTEWHHGAHNEQSPFFGVKLRRQFLIRSVWKTFPTLSQIQSKPPSPFPKMNPCVRESVRVRKKMRMKWCFALPMLCKLSWCITHLCNWSSVENC